ncbi:MAG: hypothetical protein ACERKV_13625 [Clostridiaceae bacterium]
MQYSSNSCNLMFPIGYSVMVVIKENEIKNKDKPLKSINIYGF